MQWPVCYYLTPQSSPADVARAFQGLHDSMRTVLENIAGDNIASSLAGEGLAFTTATREVPKKLLVTIADSTKAAYVRTKTDTHNKARGIEVHVDADNADDGKFCVCNSDEPDIQRWSVDPDPSTDSAPGATLVSPTGATTINTGVDANVLIKRNSVLQQTFDGTKILGAVTYSSPGAGASSERYGAVSVAAGDGGTAIGNDASAAGLEATALGFGTRAAHQASIVLGVTASSTAAKQLVVGAGSQDDRNITEVYIGGGVLDDTPVGVTINASGGTGENIAGAELVAAGGKGTGTGVGGPVTIKIAPAGASSSTLNSLVEAFKVYATSAGVIINETGIDRDLRVEGENDVDLLFVDASTDRVGIGTNAPGEKLDVDGVIRGTELKIPIAAPGTPANAHMWFDTAAFLLKVHYDGTTYEFTPSGP